MTSLDQRNRPDTPPGRPTRPDESMSLLRDLLENPLDVGYRHAAERRTDGRAVPWWQRVLVVVACIAIGMGVVWAARELRAPQSGILPARSLLLEQIDERTAEGDALQAENEAYASEIQSLEQAGLALVDEDLAAQLDRLAVASGSVAVTGSGIVVRLEDSPAAQEGAPGTEDERVTDIDLQVLVNSLWAADAEAISVNDRRLGSTTAIRTAGEAILVNLHPVVSPYEVAVIGDPTQLQTGLARTPGSTHLSVLQSTYSIGVEIRTEEEITMGPLTGVAPRFAEPLGGVASAPSGVPPSGEQSAGPSEATDEGVR